jgi:hypothetical protein
MRQLCGYTIVATNRRAIVATFEPASDFLSRQRIQQLSRQLSRLWNWLNYSAHDSRRDSAHYRACSFSIVKPGVKVITIEPSADALSVEEVVTLFSAVFGQICGLREVSVKPQELVEIPF